MPAKKRERMSSVDVAWLRMDRPSNLMMICGVLVLGEPIAFARLKATLTRRFLRFPRFRQRPVQTPGGYQWQTDSEFALEHHVQKLVLPRGAGDVELEARVSELLSTPLDPSHPLWQFHLVANYQGGSALILRIH